ASIQFKTELGGDRLALTRSLAAIHETSGQILDELAPDKGFVAKPSPSLFPQSAPSMDAEDFGKFHSEYRERVVQSVVGLVRDRDRAEDIAARAFQLGWEKRKQFRGDASLHTWIQAIARNEVRNLQSGWQGYRFESMDQTPGRDFAAPELVTDELEKRDDRSRLHQALAQVPLRSRRALIEHFVEGRSVREVAQRLQVPVGTVLSRIHKGKQLLREAWEAGLPVAQTDVPVPARFAKPQERDAQGRKPAEEGLPTTDSPDR